MLFHLDNTPNVFNVAESFVLKIIIKSLPKLILVLIVKKVLSLKDLNHTSFMLVYSKILYFSANCVKIHKKNIMDQI